MEKLIYLDVCMHSESRTKRIAEAIIDALSARYNITTITLNGADYPAVNSEILNERNNGYVPEKYVATARQIAEADRIVIAAPFYDMSYPAILKLFIENMSLFGITFNTNEKECYGLCKSKKVIYITTRGMNISTGDPLEQATPYIKAISHLWGLGEVYTISAQNMDYVSPEEVEQKIEDAINEGLELCKTF